MTDYTQAQLRELLTIGCDLGDRKSQLHGIRADETDYELPSIPTTKEGFTKAFAGMPKAHVVIEVGTHARWVSALLKQLGHVVTVANPRQVRLITHSTKKNDKADAKTLAKLGRADISLLSPVKFRGPEAQTDLAIAKARDAAVRARTMFVNQARSLTKMVGERLPSCDTERFHRKTRDAVPQELKPALEPIYELLEAVEKAIDKLDEAIANAAKERYPDLERVAQPKGVGLLTAFVFMATIDDKRRFAKSRDVGSFIGVCPKQRQSGRGDPQLHISKAGDPFLRRLLVQSAHHILGPFGEDSDLRRWGLELCRRGGKNAKKRALVAVARKLAILMHRLWTTGEDYKPLGYGIREDVAVAA